MCGIAGRFRVAAAGASDAVQRAVEALVHRGPDDSGFYAGGCVEFGHRRLSIIDPSPAGHQPMWTEDGRFAIVYNGEVYNFRQILTELKAGHPTFKTVSQTDTEVVLKAYAKWGRKCLDHLRGMFAFAVWDEPERRLFLARDRFGIKPLYYYYNDTFFLFASEVRALLATGLVAPRLSLHGMASYLQYGSAQDPLTIIEGVRSLRPGHCILVDQRDGAVRVEEVPYADNTRLLTPVADLSDRQEAVALLRELLKESVRLHLVSDVPLGVFLSGGIDSSAIVALMSEVTGERPKTFSVVFSEDEFSEAHHARLVARQFGTEHQEILLEEPDLLEVLPAALQGMDQPTMDGINTYVISKAVKAAGVTVSLSGLGGDELFSGYPSFQRARRLRALAKVPRSVRKTISGIGRAMWNGTAKQNKFWQLLESNGTPQAAYEVSRQLFAPGEIQNLLPGVFAAAREQPEEEYQDVVNAVSLCELSGYMANTLLRDTDCMSMAHSLEVRVPFIDTVIVQYVLGLPGRWKVDAHRPKPLLLDAIQDLLSPDIWQRPKMGFTFPFERWMRQQLRREMDQVLSQSPYLKGLGVNPQYAGEIWQRFKESHGKEPWSRPWALYVLQKWCQLNGVQA